MTNAATTSRDSVRIDRTFTARAIKVIALLTILIIMPFLTGNDLVTRVFISALMLGVMAAVFDLMIGFAGLINFGFAGFVAVGAYTSALGTYHYGISPWAGLVLGGVATAAVGFAAGVITLRLRGLYVALTTFFIGEAIRFTISNTPDFTRGMLGLTVAPFPDILGLDFGRDQILNYYYLLLFMGSLIMLAMVALIRSNFGLAFKALREDQLATESLGLSTTLYKLYNFTIASFFAGVMGSYYAHYVGTLSPSPTEFGVTRTVEILTITYVGGRGSLWGAIIAGFLLVGLQEYFRGLGPWRLVIYGCVLILTMLFARRGLAGVLQRAW